MQHCRKLNNLNIRIVFFGQNKGFLYHIFYVFIPIIVFIFCFYYTSFVKEHYFIFYAVRYIHNSYLHPKLKNNKLMLI